MAPEDYDLATFSLSTFEPVRLAQILIPIWMASARGDGASGVLTDSEAFTALDQTLAPSLLRQDTQRVSRLYLNSFVWRHSAVWLAAAIESNNQGVHFTLSRAAHSPFVHHLTALNESVANGGSACQGLHLSLTARGLEWRWMPKDTCGHFDPYEPASLCPRRPERRGGVCSIHSHGVWHSPADPQAKGTERTLRPSLNCRHQTMMSFYSDFRNLNAYSTDELKALIETFWNKVLRSKPAQPAALATAAAGLGYPSLTEVCSLGPDELRKRYRNLARAHHPDRGGQVPAFHDLTNAFQLLNRYIQDHG
jgi:hypothetical protein